MSRISVLCSFLFVSVIFLAPLNSFARESTLDKTKNIIKETTHNASEYLDDTSLTTAIKAKFMAEKGLESMEISVKTIDNVVMLNGTVDTLSQSRLAELIAQHTKGVKSVKNDILVKK